MDSYSGILFSSYSEWREAAYSLMTKSQNFRDKVKQIAEGWIYSMMTIYIV